MHVRITNGELMKETLGIATKELKEVVIRSVAPYQGRQIIEEWDKCTNTEKAEFRSRVYIQVIEYFVRKQKVYLKSLNISFEGMEIKKFEATVDLIAEGTGSLEELGLVCKNVKKGLFNKLVARNPWMKKIGITLQNSIMKNAAATNLVESSLGANKSEEIIVELRGINIEAGTITSITNICHKHMSRCVHVSVFNRSYLN